MANLIEQYKKEYREVFAERKQTRTKNRVFDLMTQLDDVNEQLSALEVQADLYNEKKEKIEAEIAAMEE